MFYSCFTEWCTMCDMGHPSDCLCFIPVLQSGALCMVWATHQTVYILFPLQTGALSMVWATHQTVYVLFLFTDWCTMCGMGHPSDCLCFIPVYRLVHYLWYGPPIRLFMFYSCLQTGALCVIWATHQTVYVLFLFYRVVHYV